MESLHSYRVLPPSKPFQNHPKILKPIALLPNSIPINKPTTAHPPHNHLFIFKTSSPSPSPSPAFLSQFPLKPDKIPHLLLGLSSFAPLPCFASETVVSANDKINLESIVVSIDDFFNRNPFFVAGVTFIWLVVVPLTQEYLKKFKFISAINAFRKLRDDPNAQLLDIRDGKSLAYLGSPNLKILNKGVVQVQFSQDDEDAFLKVVSTKFADPNNTTVCVLDNFDGNSMKVAELLFKNGFKEAYAIRGGIRGKNGWQAIQENLLPPSVHIYPKKKVKMSRQPEVNGGIIIEGEDNSKASSSASVPLDSSETVDNGYVKKPIKSTPQAKLGSRSSSPYPNYPDLKPPSSPTPAKPRT
ncbi:unnamed protein product, partial [Vitis vinifera]|uniref:Rhodanese domain-containing protein n=1 Tax=Vitis vinifera TaxID=29760 RepID=E0CW02_VITVI